MATVFLAEDLRHTRHVALKVLRPELAAVLGAERFVQEIKTTAQLQHPHINILLHNGRPVVADFGIALALSAAAGGRRCYARAAAR